MKTRACCIIAVLLFSMGTLSAQTVSNSSFVLNVDYARFQNDENSAYLEIYYGFYPRLITLEPRNGVFRGGVILQMSLSNVKTNEVLKHERSLLPIAVTDTSSSSSRSTVITQAGYMLPYGEYRLHVMAVDSLTPARVDSTNLLISLRPYGTAPAFSDIELCSEIKSSEDKSNAFFKNSLEVVPNPTLVFGVTASPVVFHYVELYNLNPDKQYTVKTQILDGLKKAVKEFAKPKKFRVASAVDVGTVNVTSIGSAKYNFVYTLMDENGKELSRSEKTFFIYNPHVQAAPISAVTLKANEMAGMSADELSAEFRKAQYVATDQDKQTFAKLTNEEGKREFLARFWVEVERGKPGKTPTRRIEYLQRVTTANLRYGNQTREGWSTDRGRIYVLYGEPDEIERLPSQSNTKPHEIWHYYQIENGVEFVFVDRSGFSEYHLVHSTKRGELRDDSWQRFLQ